MSTTVTNNDGSKGIIAGSISTAIGAGAGYAAYKITPTSIVEGVAKDILAQPKDQFIKNQLDKAVDYTIKTMKAEGATEDAIATAVEHTKQVLGEGMVNAYETAVTEAKGIISKCKRTKVAIIAGAAALGLGIYALIKGIKSKKDSE